MLKFLLKKNTLPLHTKKKKRKEKKRKEEKRKGKSSAQLTSSSLSVHRLAKLSICQQKRRNKGNPLGWVKIFTGKTPSPVSFLTHPPPIFSLFSNSKALLLPRCLHHHRPSIFLARSRSWLPFGCSHCSGYCSPFFFLGGDQSSDDNVTSDVGFLIVF